MPSLLPHIYIHTHAPKMQTPPKHTHHMQNANANSLSGSHTPGSHYERSRAKNFRRKAFPHSKWCGHPKSHLDHCRCMRKDLEFAPQQMPGTQSQLWTGRRQRKKKNQMKNSQVGVELRSSGPEPRNQPIHQYTHTCTHTCTHTHTQF